MTLLQRHCVDSHCRCDNVAKLRREMTLPQPKRNLLATSQQPLRNVTVTFPQLFFYPSRNHYTIFYASYNNFCTTTTPPFPTSTPFLYFISECELNETFNAIFKMTFILLKLYRNRLMSSFFSCGQVSLFPDLHLLRLTIAAGTAHAEARFCK